MELTILLPADLGIEHAATLRATLAAQVTTREPVVLVASEVRGLHTATLQVLAAFVSVRTAAGCPTTWRNPPAILRESAARLGLECLLGLTTVSLN